MAIATLFRNPDTAREDFQVLEDGRRQTQRTFRVDSIERVGALTADGMPRFGDPLDGVDATLKAVQFDFRPQPGDFWSFVTVTYRTVLLGSGGNPDAGAQVGDARTNYGRNVGSETVFYSIDGEKLGPDGAPKPVVSRNAIVTRYVAVRPPLLLSIEGKVNNAPFTLPNVGSTGSGDTYNAGELLYLGYSGPEPVSDGVFRVEYEFWPRRSFEVEVRETQPDGSAPTVRGPYAIIESANFSPIFG